MKVVDLSLLSHLRAEDTEASSSDKTSQFRQSRIGPGGAPAVSQANMSIILSVTLCHALLRNHLDILKRTDILADAA